MTNLYSIQNHSSEKLHRLAQFIQRYRNAYPAAKLMAAEFYTYHPALENGRNVLCAVDAEGQMRGFAPMFPTPLPPVGEPGTNPADPHSIWMILLADPEAAKATEARGLLFDRLMVEVQRIGASFPPGRRVLLSADLMACQKPDIDFLKEKGFEQCDGMFVMRRSQAKPVPEHCLPDGLEQRCGKLAAESEQTQYLQAYNRCFQEVPKTIEALRFLLESPLWKNGTALSAFDRLGAPAGSILVYYDEKNAYWILDDVFTLPEWRGRGLAKSLIAEGLRICRSQSPRDAFLEVKQANLPAVSVYRAMGFEIIDEEVILGMYLW